MSTVPLEIEADVAGLDPGDPSALALIRGQASVAKTPGAVQAVRLVPDAPPACPEALAAVEDADWVIPDPERRMSRLHCVLAVQDGRLLLRDTSSNGVFVGEERRRLPPLEPTPVAPGEVLRLGGFLIAVDPEADGRDGFDAPFNQPMLKPMSVSGDALAVPTDWDEIGRAHV